MVDELMSQSAFAPLYGLNASPLSPPIDHHS